MCPVYTADSTGFAPMKAGHPNINQRRLSVTCHALADLSLDAPPSKFRLEIG